MDNPWEKIDLKIYETHMASNNVYQLQTLKSITESQMKDYVHTNVLILGISGGNGLEHIDVSQTKKIVGIDVNSQYLNICRKRYQHLTDILELVCCDLTNSDVELPYSDIMICNLIIEYIGINTFIELIQNNKESINIISIILQKNNDNGFVSNSSFSSSFKILESILHNIDEDNLRIELLKIGFNCINKLSYPLPNGKEFLRIDFKKLYNSEYHPRMGT